MQDETRLTGTVSAVFRGKNFAFITSDGVEYFAHESACMDFEGMEPGTKVSFTPVKTQKGERAVAVRLV